MSPQELEVLNWFKFAWPGPLVRESQWLFAFGESIHFIGLCLLLGSMLFVDLRLMGYFKKFSVRAVLAYVPFAILGFVLCASTGWLFFTSNPAMYWENTAFIVKMVAVLLAGLNALIFTVWEHPKVVALGPGEDAPPSARFFAAASLLLWFTVLLLGRWLPIFTVGTN